MKQRVALIFLTLLLLFSPALGAFSAFHTQARAEWVGLNFGLDNDQAKINNTMSNAPYLLHTLINQMLSFTCNIYPFFGPNYCTNNKEIQTSLLNKSAIGNIAMAMGTMYDNPPADLAYWIRDTGQSLGFIPRQAYAQGVGFRGLAPLLPIWKAFRNIAYALLALAMIVVGFMVMMRKKIDPKTVVTVQNSLPRIVIALILITFSYAIVGFLVDIMYLVIAFLHFLVQANLTDTIENMSSGRINYVSGGFFDLFFSIFGALQKFNPSAQVGADLATGQYTEAIKDYASGLITNTLGVGPLFLLLLSLFYLFAFVRVLFMLLGSYVQIILSVLTGPIQILTDVFPGANGFTNWIKNLIANLIVFPITIVLLMIANALNQHFGAGTLWTPPLLPQPVVQTAFGDVGGMGGLAETLVAVGIIMMIPNIVKGLKEAFKTQPLIGGRPGGGVGGAVSAISTLYYAQAMTPKAVKDRIASMFGGGSPTEPK